MSTEGINWDFASNTPTCAAPALIRGVAWRHLTADQFACPTRIVGVRAPGGTAAAAADNATAATGVRATAGTNATVECVAAGDPEPLVSWSRDGHLLAPPAALVSVRQAPAGDDEPRIVSLLTLVGVSAARDAGRYSCVAENTAGRAEMTFKLVVVDAPRRRATPSVWPVDRDAFLGVVLGLLAVAGLVVVSTAVRLYVIARRRRRRRHRQLDDKSVYYVGNHVDAATAVHSPQSNHRPQPPTILQSRTATIHDDDDDDNSRPVSRFDSAFYHFRS